MTRAKVCGFVAALLCAGLGTRSSYGKPSEGTPLTWRQKIAGVVATINALPDRDYHGLAVWNVRVSGDSTASRFTITEWQTSKRLFEKRFIGLPRMQTSNAKPKNLKDTAVIFLRSMQKSKGKIPDFDSLGVILSGKKAPYSVTTRYRNPEKYVLCHGKVYANGKSKLQCRHVGPNTHFRVKSFIAALDKLPLSERSASKLQLRSTVSAGLFHVTIKNGERVVLRYSGSKAELRPKRQPRHANIDAAEAAAIVIDRAFGNWLVDDDQRLDSITVSVTKGQDNLLSVDLSTDSNFMSILLFTDVNPRGKIIGGLTFNY